MDVKGCYPYNSTITEKSTSTSLKAIESVYSSNMLNGYYFCYMLQCRFWSSWKLFYIFINEFVNMYVVYYNFVTLNQFQIWLDWVPIHMHVSLRLNLYSLLYAPSIYSTIHTQVSYIHQLKSVLESQRTH